MMELVQGEGGVIALEKDYVTKVVEIAKKHDLLIIIDEVQTGNGRTGTLYAYMQYGFTPYIVSTAKGLGGGLPLGACMLGEKVKNTLGAGDHGSTFGGNPVCCAGAISIISRIDDKLLSEVREKAAYIRSELEGTKGLKSVSGLGLMIGLDCDKPAAQVASELLAKGVIVLTAHSKVRLVPPLNIEMDDLKEAVKIIKEVISK
jgi:acetylornithine/N-succinyldiaminopimelate aminotransferase